MKTTSFASFRLIFFVHLLALPFANAQTGTFTYQGRLTQGASAFNGIVEFQPTLWNAANNGTQVAANSPALVVASVTNGLFTIPLNFGASFTGADRWLQLEMRTVIGPFTLLSPRQQITPAPYAITASNISGSLPAGQLSGAIPSANFSGTYTGAVTLNNLANSFSGNGAGLTSLSASALTGTVPDAQLSGNIARTAQVWQLGGNAGTTAGTQFLGTTDNQPMEFKVNGVRALRLEPPVESPNVIAGAASNLVAAGTYGATISGGGLNEQSGFSYPNIVSGDYAVIAGGVANAVRSYGGIVSGGYNNEVRSNSHYGTISGGIHNSIGTNSGYSRIGGGYANTVGANAEYNSIGGGQNNEISTLSRHSAVAGGFENKIGTNVDYGVIGGGSHNNIGMASDHSTVGGGTDNIIGTNAYSSTIAGGQNQKINARAIYAFIGGGYQHAVSTNARYSTIVGGRFHSIDENSFDGFVGGGYGNDIGPSSVGSSIVGGFLNQIQTNNSHSFIGGGHENWLMNNASNSVILGGAYQIIGTNSQHATIGGGYNNQIHANSDFATIPGGRMNRATNYAFAAGHRATADHTGAFVWADSSSSNVFSTNQNSVTMRASGGYRLFTRSDITAGAYLAPNGTAWGVISDRNAKKDIEPLDSREVLEKLAALPITQWHYQWEEPTETPHIGPMAQDFKAAFYPGRDDKHITTQEADGVALAAIQGLNQKLEAKEAELEAMKQRLEKLERLLESR